MDRLHIWVVTYWESFLTGPTDEPVVSVFDNEEAAQKCYKYFKQQYSGCCIDKAPIYHEFFLPEENTRLKDDILKQFYEWKEARDGTC